MKKKLISIGLLNLIICVHAQTGNVLCHVGQNAKVYISKNTLVYNGGGVKLVDNAIVENHGNVMVVGNSSDIFVTVDNSGNAKTEANGGGNFVNKLNEPDNYSSVNTSTSPSLFTYGQLYINGLAQDKLTAIVDQEYRQVKQGSYQQVSLPFFNKTFSTLSTASEFNKVFTNTRWSQNEILKWNNAYARFDFVDQASKTLSANGNNDIATGYYILGSNNLDTSSKVFTIKGVPYAEENISNVTIKDAGSTLNYGTGGVNRNIYNERYNTYLQDGFHIASGGTAWQGDYGKNLYQYGNPFLTNLDLSKIAYDETTTGASVGDGNNLSNIYGIRLEVSGVQYKTNVGGGSTSYKYVVFTNQASTSQAGTPQVPVGDVDYLMIRPMGTFVIKYKDNTTPANLDFKTLRRFNYLTRSGSTGYNISAARTSSGKANANTNNTNTVKQLGVIALDADGNEIGRTYYVVYADAYTGHSDESTSQMSAFSDNVIGTYEEAPNGGYDNNYTGSYWLYINEANENNFKGKNIKLVNYSSNIKSYKFEIRENANLIDEGTHLLSSGEGFYLKPSSVSGDYVEAKQGGVVSVLGDEYDLYYGKPSGTLGTTNGVTPSRTKILYVDDTKEYIVKFDPNWKKADVYIHDMSGKLVFSEKNVSASTDYLIKLNGSVKNVYIVNVVSELGEKVTSKIIK